MERKKIIQLVVVVGAFLGSGLVLYNNFFAPPIAAPIAVMSGSAASLTPTSILPYGSSFNYQEIDNMEKQGFQFGQIQYPVLSTSTDVGKTPGELIVPLPVQSAP